MICWNRGIILSVNLHLWPLRLRPGYISGQGFREIFIGPISLWIRYPFRIEQ